MWCGYDMSKTLIPPVWYGLNPHGASWEHARFLTFICAPDSFFFPLLCFHHLYIYFLPSVCLVPVCGPHSNVLSIFDAIKRLFEKSKSLHQSRRAVHRCECLSPPPSPLLRRPSSQQAPVYDHSWWGAASMKVPQERSQTAAKSAVVSDASLPLGIHKTTRKRHRAQGKTWERAPWRSHLDTSPIHASTCY